MPVHSSPGPSRPSDPPNLLGSTVDYVAPVLRMVKDGVTGLPVPGLEAAVGGAAAVLETTQV